MFHICVKFEVSWIYFKTFVALRPRTLFRSFYYTKNRTLSALSNYCESLNNKNSLEPLNRIFLEIGHLKVSLGQI